jgi:tetratricopeptide (TPR) repeat protein
MIGKVLRNALLPALLLGVALGIALFLAATAFGPEASEGPAPSAITIDYPADGTLFPPEIIAPTILWHDPSHAREWRVEVAFADGGRIESISQGDPPPRREIDERAVSPTNEIYEPTPYQASAHSWRPTRDVWEQIKRRSLGAPATLTIRGTPGGSEETYLSEGKVRIETSTDPVGAPIFYRDVPLMPSQGKDGVIKPLDQESLPLIAWRLKDVSREDNKLLLTDMPTCANCHSFPRDGSTLAMDLDGPDGDKGAYAIASIGKRTVIDSKQVMTWNAFPGRGTSHFTLGFLARISPDGSKVIATVNESLYVRNYTDWKTLQTFYPTRGILAWYDRATAEIRALPGADDKEFVHCDAVWTPDGKNIVLARARARDPYDRNKPVATFAGDANETEIRYDLYRMPFDDGTGGSPVPIAGASNNGMSNSFPKVSPDGKWVVFVKSRNGQLLRPDGKLWIVPLEGGTAREMRCNGERMNSWHSFSPNGKWMVFSSKRNTPYTQMFLTHIDEDGNDSPAVLLEGTTLANRAVNLPEFVNRKYDSFDSIVVPATEYIGHFNRGNELSRAGRYAEALAAFETALGDGPEEWRVNEWRIHDSMSKTLLKMGRKEQAMEHIRASLDIWPRNAEMQANLGYLLFENGQLNEARGHLDLALRLAPDDPQAWTNRGSVRLSQGDVEGAEADYSTALERDADYGPAWRGRGMVRLMRGDAAAAESDLNRAVGVAPEDAAVWFFRARARAILGNRAGARADLDRAASLLPADSPQVADIEALRRQIE